MGEHDYAVLAVVAVVAIAAVISMAVYVPSEGVQDTRNFIPVTGFATTNYADVVSGTPPDYDFTGDGRLTVEDSYLLAEYIYTQRCPRTKTCDVNGDGVVNMLDLELFNTMIESPATAPQPVARAPQVISRSTQRSAGVGARLA